jgi:hypothetical protein
MGGLEGDHNSYREQERRKQLRQERRKQQAARGRPSWHPQPNVLNEADTTDTGSRLASANTRNKRPGGIGSADSSYTSGHVYRAKSADLTRKRAFQPSVRRDASHIAGNRGQDYFPTARELEIRHQHEQDKKSKIRHAHGGRDLSVENNKHSRIHHHHATRVDDARSLSSLGQIYNDDGLGIYNDVHRVGTEGRPPVQIIGGADNVLLGGVGMQIFGGVGGFASGLPGRGTSYTGFDDYLGGFTDVDMFRSGGMMAGDNSGKNRGNKEEQVRNPPPIGSTARPVKRPMTAGGSGPLHSSFNAFGASLPSHSTLKPKMRMALQVLIHYESDFRFKI